MDEIWKPIPAAPDYEISNMGRARRAPSASAFRRRPKPGALLRQYDGRRGYKSVSVCGRVLLVHRLVAEAFCGTAPSPESVVDHLDNDTRNNRADNLEWVSQSENLQRGFERGTKTRTGGSRKGRQKTPTTPIAIQREIADLRGKMSQSEIGRKYGLRQTTISTIQRRLLGL